MRKSERQAELSKLVRSEDLASQLDIVRKMRDRGFSVTQASISRDLEELGILKVNGRYAVPRSPVELGQATFLPAGDNLVVGRCMSGLASAVTVRIDRSEIEGIVGTIAGDDTIFVAVADRESRDRVLADLGTLFGE